MFLDARAFAALAREEDSNEDIPAAPDCWEDPEENVPATFVAEVDLGKYIPVDKTGATPATE